LNYTGENNLSDQQLVDQVLSGDTQCFGIIIKKTERLVAQIVFKMVSNSEDRKDVAQDIYLKAYKGLPGFKFQSRLSTWIGKISYNTCLGYLEKRKLHLLPPVSESDEVDDLSFESLVNKSVSMEVNEVEAFIFQKERSEILTMEIELLPPLYKTLITLYHNEELSYAEIAQITALPEGTVKNYLFRARKNLRENLLRKYNRQAL
jgi:RNA polymerase sigma-70 factor (ECF subfamily)